MNWLDRLSILKLTTISLGLLAVSVLFLVFKEINHSVDDLAAAQNDEQLIELLEAIEKVAHNHAVERGLTAGYLGNPTDTAKTKVDNQRKNADAAVTKLNELLKKDWPELFQINAKINPLLNHLTQKSSVRREVDAVNGQRAFGYYSKLNAFALESARMITLSINDPDSAANLSYALLYAAMKERMGQLRGKANGAIARSQVTGNAAADLETYAEDINQITEKLRFVLPTQQRQSFLSVMDSKTSKDIASYVSILTSQYPDFSQLPNSSTWFGLATQQIGDVKQLLDGRWSAIYNLAVANQSRAMTSLITTISVVSILAFVIVLINIRLIKILRKQLSQLTFNLDKIAREGDLTVDVSMNTANELGAISRSVNHTILALKDLIVGMDQSIGTSSRLTKELGSATTEMLEDSDNTLQRSITIASAIEEMAATGQEIASSAVKTLDASKSLDSIANEAMAANAEIESAMQQLSTDMREVETNANAMELQVTEISSILDTINSLSDQTNLLALNAAIEAARAGEHGRGFAVVADEVRQLAQASRDSSDKISSLLSTLQEASITVVKGISNNSAAAQQSLDTTEIGKATAQKVRNAALNVEDMANSMSAAAEQQSTTAGQIAQDMVEVQQAANHEVELARNLRDLAERMKENNNLLQRTMDNFRIE